MGHVVEFLPNYRSISIFDKEMPINPYCWFIIKNIEEDRCTKLYYRGVASGGVADYAHHITTCYDNTGCGDFKRGVQN